MVALAVAIALVMVLAPSAAASLSHSGYRNCSPYWVQTGSNTAAYNSNHFVRHTLDYNGTSYSSDTFFTPGVHVWTFYGLRYGTWQVYVSNGYFRSWGTACV